MTERVNPKLLNDFLGYVLDCHKSGNLSRTAAIGAIDHLIASLDLPGDVGSDPTNYMKNVMASGFKV